MIEHATRAVDPKIAEAAQKADERLRKKNPYSLTPITNHLDNLMTFGKVEVGWRESCGKTDPTMCEAREWLKLVKRMERAGISLTVERVKHGNGYATLKGGWWNSEIYRLANQKEAA